MKLELLYDFGNECFEFVTRGSSSCMGVVILLCVIDFYSLITYTFLSNSEINRLLP